MTPNAIVEYIDEDGKVLWTREFYDPGLDINSWLTKELKERGVWKGLHLAYGCGRPLHKRS